MHAWRMRIRYYEPAKGIRSKSLTSAFSKGSVFVRSHIHEKTVSVRRAFSVIVFVRYLRMEALAVKKNLRFQMKKSRRVLAKFICLPTPGSAMPELNNVRMRVSRIILSCSFQVYTASL